MLIAAYKRLVANSILFDRQTSRDHRVDATKTDRHTPNIDAGTPRQALSYHRAQLPVCCTLPGAAMYTADLQLAAWPLPAQRFID